MLHPPGVAGTKPCLSHPPKSALGGRNRLKLQMQNFPFPWLGSWEFWGFLSLDLHPQGILAALSLPSLMSSFVHPWLLSGLTAECPSLLYLEACLKQKSHVTTCILW